MKTSVTLKRLNHSPIQRRSYQPHRKVSKHIPYQAELQDLLEKSEPISMDSYQSLCPRVLPAWLLQEPWVQWMNTPSYAVEGDTMGVHAAFMTLIIFHTEIHGVLKEACCKELLPPTSTHENPLEN